MISYNLWNYLQTQKTPKTSKNGSPPPGIMLRIHGLRQGHQGPAQTGHHEVVLVLRGGIGFQQRQQLVLIRSGAGDAMVLGILSRKHGVNMGM